MTEIKLSIGYEDYENGKKMDEALEELAGRPEAAELTDLIIGDWGGAYENSSELIVEALVRLKDRFPALKSLFIGDMGFEECEVSWIMQSNLNPLFGAFPDLTSLTVKGSTDLELGEIEHARLEELTIICGGLGSRVLASIAEAKLPALKKLELYIGIEDYGFDGTTEDVLAVAKPGLFPNLTYLGLKDSEIQDEIAEAIAESDILDRLDTLDLSEGTLSDAGAQALLDSAKVRALNVLDLHYHYMSADMTRRIQSELPNANVDERQEADVYNGEEYRSPMLTE
ncbi:STM4015 family protein [Saccharibacillus sp. CPCC 101409]|uniref:STM4015 family protein n=1 Tax=Saccharibacillus sp. CPCC 101409 TaxID=3058041 RepID=UPI0026736268|nr:STM4015 family protein [Saccharibacillus sp. CPCC 101409]MDO3409559.1 STM4015 family protein [Saccharibacillus sp. CPCC 101409]